MKQLRMVLITLALCCAFTGLSHGQQTWQREAAASAHYIAGFSPDSLQLDNNGMPVMVYGGDGLYLARFDGASWTIETLDQMPFVASHTYLRFDADNDAHIAYSDWHPDWDKYGIKYVYQDNGAWQKREIPDMEYAGPLFSMDLDSNGRPWIIYFDEENDVVEIINDDGSGGWNRETLFMSTVPMIGLELAMEGDYPRFAYANGLPGETILQLGYKTPTGYEYAGIDSNPGAGNYLDIELDSTGFVHMSYWNSVEDALYYVETDPLGWPGFPVKVDSTGTSAGIHSSLALDTTDQPVISYVTASEYAVKSARYDGINWIIDTVATSTDSPAFTSLAYSDSGIIDISYLDKATLKCARITGTGISSTSIDTSRRLVRPTCSVMNSAGNPSIMYRDQFNGYFYLAMPYGSSWRSSQLPNIEISVRDATMDIDQSTGYKAVAWFSTATDHLMYMEQTSDGWSVETVDTNDLYYSNECELSLDSQGVPHLVYTTAVPSLRYATRSGTTWTTSEVSNLESGEPRMVLDETGNRHLVFLDSSVALNYGFSTDGATWNINVIKNMVPTFSKPAIQVDSTGAPHVMYPDPASASIIHYWYVNSMWSSEVVVNYDIGFLAETDYLIDPTGVHWMVFSDNVNFKVKAAWGTSGSWQEEIIDPRKIEVGDMHLTVDSINRVSLSYSDAFNADIYHAQLRSEIWYDIGMPTVFFQTGSPFEVTRKIHNTTSQDLTVDEYFFLEVLGEYWFAPNWTQEGQFQVTGVQARTVDYEVPLYFTWPPGTGFATGIRFWGGIVDSVSGIFLDYDMVEFGWKE